MRNLEKYKGVIPAFYACYDDEGKVSREMRKAISAQREYKNLPNILWKRE